MAKVKRMGSAAMPDSKSGHSAPPSKPKSARSAGPIKAKIARIATSTKPKKPLTTSPRKPLSGRSKHPANSPSLAGVVVRSQNTRQPPILPALPTEVLARIYDLAYGPPKVSLNFHSKKRHQYRVLPAPPGLLLTCKEIQKKLIAHYYASTKFFIKYLRNGCPVNVLDLWLSRIGQPRAELVGGVYITAMNEVELADTRSSDPVTP